MADQSKQQTKPSTADQSSKPKQQQANKNSSDRGNVKKQAALTTETTHRQGAMHSAHSAKDNSEMVESSSGDDDDVLENIDAHSDNEDEKTSKVAPPKEIVKPKTAKAPTAIFGKDAITRNLRIPSIGAFTVPEILAFLPNWVRRFELLYRFVENGFDVATMIKILLLHRNAGKNHPRFSSALHHAFGKVFKDQGYDRWNVTSHHRGDFALNGDTQTEHNLVWDNDDLTFKGGKAMFDHVIKKPNGNILNNVRFKNLANGVVRFPDVTSGDALRLTSCVEYALQNPDQDLMFPRDFEMLCNRLDLGAARHENLDREVLARWKKVHKPKYETAASDDDAKIETSSKQAAPESRENSFTLVPVESVAEDAEDLDMQSIPQRHSEAMEGVENEMGFTETPVREHSMAPRSDYSQVTDNLLGVPNPQRVLQSPSQYGHTSLQQQPSRSNFMTAPLGQCSDRFSRFPSPSRRIRNSMMNAPSTPASRLQQQQQQQEQQMNGLLPWVDRMSTPVPGPASPSVLQPQILPSRLEIGAAQPSVAPAHLNQPFAAMDSFLMPCPNPQASTPAAFNPPAQFTTGLWFAPDEDGNASVPAPIDAYNEFTDQFIDHDWIPNTMIQSEAQGGETRMWDPESQWQEEHAAELADHVYFE